ncbi:MAG: phenylalanine--tRNA ligase subunit beta [Acidimicrobiales bacterium]|nr:MAG: phenylalanine--tRNA ligase subunit beta [Acidimicrobiales bacterium]
MRVPVSWLRDFIALELREEAGPGGFTVAELDAALVRSGLEVEAVHRIGDELRGPIVIGEVVSIVELTGFKKPIRHCQVDVGEAQPRSIVCGARNFAVGDWVVVSLPGAVLAGGFEITARTTYGQLSDGMICALDELGISPDHHSGILVLAREEFAGQLRPGDDAVAALGLPDVVFELAVTPDRGYCLSIRGVARELSSALNLAFTDPAELSVPAATDAQPYPVRLDAAARCDRFAARVVRGFNPDSATPWWMQRRLLLSGVRSISLAVDVTNYLMLELGQPMHAYDLATLQGQMVVRRAHAGEKLQTLDGTQRVLDPEDVVIADDSGPIGLAAVMGGATTEVSSSTTQLFIEAAHWDPVVVARSARRHQLGSEASKRFERGVDTELGLVAAQRAVRLLVDLGGAVADPNVLDFDARVPSLPIELDPGLPDRVAGASYGADAARAALQAIGCTVETGTDNAESWAVTPPSWRPDLSDPIDLVEEVLRLRGYDAIGSQLPPAPASPGLTFAQRRLRGVSRALAEDGYVEVISYPFTVANIAEILGFLEDDPRRSACTLANPLDDAEPLLRTSLLPGVLKALARNVARGQRGVALFESGLVYLPEAGASPAPRLPVDARPSDEQVAQLYAAVPHQPRHIAVALTGERLRSGWWGSGEAADWSDAVDAARTVAAAVGIQLHVRQAEYAPWHPGRCAELAIVGPAGSMSVVGHAGELHPGVVARLGLPPRTVAMELDLDALPEPAVPCAPRLSAFPPALLDVALVVPADTPASAVEGALRAGAGDLLESLRLFDVFSGAQLGEDNKSLAYALTFRAADRTLTLAEATAARDTAVERARLVVGAKLRS